MKKYVNHTITKIPAFPVLQQGRLMTIACILLLFAAGCKKDNTVFVPQGADINVINAALGAVSVKVNTGLGNFAWSRTTDEVNYGSNKYYTSSIGSRTVTVVSKADTTKTLFAGVINLQQPINTLYLIGTAPAIDTMFRSEQNLPFIDATALKRDNATYVRFVNLSPNSTPLNIKLTTGTDNEVSSLPYKGIASFKRYVAETTTANYVFEIRDAVAPNTLRLTYTMVPNNVRYKTVTLVIRGTLGVTSGADAFSISQVNYLN